MFFYFLSYIALSMRSAPEDEPPDPQQLRLDRMLESEVSLSFAFCLIINEVVLFW